MHKKVYAIISGNAALKAGLKKNDLTIWEEITERNENTLKAIYTDIEAGKTFYQETKNNLIIAHRSTRKGVLIQISYFWKEKTGELIPASHKDICSEKEFIFEKPFYIGSIQEV